MDVRTVHDVIDNRDRLFIDALCDLPKESITPLLRKEVSLLWRTTLRTMIDPYLHHIITGHD